MDIKDIIYPYYQKRLAMGYRDYRALGWESDEAQKMRFAVLTDNLDLEGCRLLDDGCGLGHLYDYLVGFDLNIAYIGIDFIPEMIEQARILHPEVDFLVQDIFSHIPEQPYDYIYASGKFNLRIDDNMDLLDKTLMRMRTLCRRAVVLNLLSDESQDMEEGYFYYSSAEVSVLVRRYFESLQVISGYLHNDFTIVCRA